MLEVLLGILFAFIQFTAEGVMTVWSWIPDNLKLPVIVLSLIFFGKNKRRR